MRTTAPDTPACLPACCDVTGDALLWHDRPAEPHHARRGAISLRSPRIKKRQLDLTASPASAIRVTGAMPVECLCGGDIRYRALTRRS